MPETKAVETVAEFVDLISQTEIVEAKDWIEGYKKRFPEALWESFLSQGVTSYSAGIIFSGISAEVLRIIARDPALEKDLPKKLDAFLQETRIKAFRSGILPKENYDESPNNS